MTGHSGPAPSPEGGVALVSPRYLAGGGDPRWVTAPLHQAFHWQAAHLPLSPRVHLTRRDLQTELIMAPDPDDYWWTLRHTATSDGGTNEGEEEGWVMRFGARTPVETIAAATDTLATTSLGREASPPDLPDPLGVLSRAGWESSGEDMFRTSPDGLVTVCHPPQGAWLISVTSHDGPWRSNPDDLVWHAYFSPHTPTPLVTAVLEDLASPEPLPRAPGSLPEVLRDLVRLTPAPAGQGRDALWERVDRLAAHRPTSTPRPPQPPDGPLPRRTR
ncbi:DUF317 domain-containing protein [Streptomyces sp. NPDC059070]|uniref:DUF317 domain-containing protein n=1 Tax=Streptomyces sp. NPDC059070 TaxID=3346713 RepID=UPI0036B71262